MTFGEYINSLSTEKISEKKRKIVEISKACCVTEIQIYNWTAGRTTPDALKRKTIAGMLNMPEEELFPMRSEK